MFSKRKYLLVIDSDLNDKLLDEYFAKFDYAIVRSADLNDIINEAELPQALLINWSLFQANTAIVDNLYQRYPVPLIIISDKADEEACVSMLEAGADDFLIKPLHPRELHARINAIIRRVQRSKQEAEPEKEVLLFADWRLYPASRQIFNENNEELLLSVGEYDLLLAFVRQPQRVLGREFLLRITKNSNLNSFDRRIDVQISRLRQKIETDTKKPALIKTIRNSGYLFTAEVLAIKENEKTKP